MTKRQDLLDRKQLRLVLAAIFLAAEISSRDGLIDDNGELAARALRRADMLLQMSSDKGGPNV